MNNYYCPKCRHYNQMKEINANYVIIILVLIMTITAWAINRITMRVGEIKIAEMEAQDYVSRH